MATPSTSTENKKRHLLKLPAELRNSIYRFTLCENSKIHISTLEATGQPALLRTCRMIREEASAIYYHENTIMLRARNFKPDLMTAFWRHAGRFNPPDKETPIQTYIGPSACNWTNLIKWVKAYWQEEVAFMQPNPMAPAIWNAGAGAFMVAKNVKLMNGTWADVERMLKDYKIATHGFMKWEDDGE